MVGRFVIIFLIIVVIELYFLQAVRTFVSDFSHGRRTIILALAISLAILNFVLGAVAFVYPPPNWGGFPRFMLGVMVILTLCKLLGCSFLLIDDIIRLFRWIFSFIIKTKTETAEGHSIPRLKFLSQLAVGFTVIPAIGFIYGIIRGAYKYRVHNVRVPSPNLPDAFHGFRIVQISDIHTGSFIDNQALKRAFDIVMDQRADMIVFTGDLVNNEARETHGFTEVFGSLKAPFGVYSILGNHDYGDYIEWESKEAKQRNLEAVKKVHADAGWRLLMNEHVPIEKNGEKIALIGVENWGGSMHFAKYGRMELAHKDTDHYPFRILMSHDPSHWDKQVTTEYTNVDLTLSGHTHGMQLGIEIPGLRWSPSKYFYKQWAGLYKKGSQFLYVNRGLGFLGYPGRLGIWPEITVIELQKA